MCSAQYLIAPTTWELLDHYAQCRSLSRRTYQQYRVALNHFARFCGSCSLSSLTEPALLGFLRQLGQSRAARTVNNKRQVILTLWRWAHRRGLTGPAPSEVRKRPEPRRLPTAWTTAELERILAACRHARSIRRWNGRHWKALLLTLYDTSLRIGAVLQIPRSDLRGDELLCRAEFQKQNADTVHRLHRTTAWELRALPSSPDGLLLSWPISRREIWREYRSILKSARLPAGRRDLFHKLRRTSYTQVYYHLGALAASRHAGHATDMSRFYLDLRLDPNATAAVDALPRPRTA